MAELLMPLVAVAAAYSFAIAAPPLLTLSGRSGWITAICASVVPLACPLLIPRDQIVERAIVSFLCGDLTFKMVDYARESRKTAAAIGYREYLQFLVPFPILLVRLRERRRLSDWPSWREVPRAIVSGIVVAAMFALLSPVNRIEAVKASFPLDHAVKLAMFVVLIEAGSHLTQSVERLAGYDTTRLVRDVYLSLTPAEFWLRYNTRVHSWLEANVFRPCGGRVRGVLAVFFVSAVLHEVTFDIATSHPDGTQFTFFMLQAPAVMISSQLKRFADQYGVVGRFAAWCLNLVWFYFTSMLFFRGVDRIFPVMYASQPWLP